MKSKMSFLNATMNSDMVMNFAVVAFVVIIGLNVMATKSWAAAQTFETTAEPLALENGVHVQKVHFPKRQIDIAGNLFTPSDYDATKKYSAIVVTHPNGGVKEQTAGLYAQKLAEKGFIALAYDASYQGESGGEPRFTEDPFSRIEDIRCATDFLTNYPSVESVGALGICAGGGYTVHAAETEARLKAVAVVSPVDTGRARREGISSTPPDAKTLDERRIRILEETAQQRTIEAAGGEPRYIGYVPNSLEEIQPGMTGMFVEGYEYYRTPRGAHPRSQNLSLFSNQDKMFEYTAMDHVDWISPRPLLLIAGSEAETLYFSQEAHNMAKDPKELFIIEGASHMDLYDKEEYVPEVVEKLVDFFGKNL
ncbi:MAG: alpha/beta hydrolase [Synergistaceae bacterium]|jgi:fermentation-respiration switch protein FrsA (DUF1100 family)|nr:alpha/beta hydrolase [Synergistaceae bacterium]